MSTCPHCDQRITHVDFEAITLSSETMTTFRGSSYSCPHCHAVLTVGVDPVSQRDDLLEALVQVLRRH